MVFAVGLPQILGDTIDFSETALGTPGLIVYDFMSYVIIPVGLLLWMISNRPRNVTISNFLIYPDAKQGDYFKKTAVVVITAFSAWILCKVTWVLVYGLMVANDLPLTISDCFNCEYLPPPIFDPLIGIPVAFSEEIVYRFFPLIMFWGALTTGFRKLAFVFLTSFYFSLVHFEQGLLSTLSSFVNGLVYSYILLQTKSFLGVSSGHVINNLDI